MNKEMNISFKLKNDINYEVEKRTWSGMIIIFSYVLTKQKSCSSCFQPQTIKLFLTCSVKHRKLVETFNFTTLTPELMLMKTTLDLHH